MRKIFKSMMAVLLLVCSIVTVSACSCNKDDDSEYVGHMFYSLNSKYKLKHDGGDYIAEIPANGIVDYLTNIKNSNSNPTTPSLEGGVRVYLVRDVTRGALTISDFDMYIKEVNDKLIAQGSFTTSAGQAKAESKFYYDGTYLGIETVENDVVDKQREELPISSIGNLVGMTTFVSDVIDYLDNATSVAKMIETIQSDSDNTSLLEVKTYKNTNGIVKDFITIDHFLTDAIALDLSYNVIGYSYSIIKDYSILNEVGIEITNHTITMPSDMDSWTTRAAA